MTTKLDREVLDLVDGYIDGCRRRVAQQPEYQAALDVLSELRGKVQELQEQRDDYRAALQDALTAIAKLPAYRSDIGDSAFEAGVDEGRQHACNSIRVLMGLPPIDLDA